MKGAGAATIAVTEDDDGDYLLLTQALQEAGLRNPVLRLVDGEELMDFLLRRGRFAPSGALPPLLILLDLRLPKMSGWEALREIRASALLRRIPVVILTTSNAEEDVARAYDMGANAFISKPADYAGYLAIARAVKGCWLELSELPRPEAP